MVGFFVIRRLIESTGRLSDTTMNCRIRVRQYPRISSRITLLNWWNLDKHFAVHSPRSKTLTLTDLCNQFIHSYVFMPVLDLRNGLHALFIVSEHSRNKALYEVPVAAIVRVFRRAGNDYPDELRSTFDPLRGDFKVRARTTKYPTHTA